jgi:ABC-type lipoprotein export system ATPase subunit
MTKKQEVKEIDAGEGVEHDAAFTPTPQDASNDAANDLANPFPRGSEWRQWDLHVHSPASFFWKGQKFSSTLDTPQDKALVDEMINSMNAAAPAVFALMDYWTFDGWFALKKRLQDKEAPELLKTVFPGIELRVSAPTDVRLNVHAIFSDQVADQDLRDFRSRLRLALIDQPLSDEALIRYARQTGEDKLKTHGVKKDDIIHDAEKALAAGNIIAELTVESYKDAIEKVPNDHALGFVPFNTSDGLESVKWSEHYAYVMTLFRTAPIFEARDDATCSAFVGRKTAQNQKWFKNFFEALGNTPRLPVSGSDAHQFVGQAGDNNKRGYGDYPSGRITWIKSDPTWLGLQQAIKEPAKRCFIGEQPPKLKLVHENKTFYLDAVKIKKVSGSALKDQWFDGAEIPLNADLVAIIGNKGSGKSALADVIALVGNSRDKDKFSFLCAQRFRGRSGEPAKQFVGRLDWVAGEPVECNLGENPAAEGVELVRYIPQGRFEELCNEHVSGRSGAFERELRTVVFDHLSDELRGDALTFEELLEEQERASRAQLDDARSRLAAINRQIDAIERNLHPDIKAQIAELLKFKERELKELYDVKPTDVPKPAEKLSVEQEAASARITAADAGLVILAERTKTTEDAQRLNATKKRAIKAAQDQIKLFETQASAFKRTLTTELEKLGLKFEDVVKLSIDVTPLAKLSTDTTKADGDHAKSVEEVSALVEAQKAIIAQATLELNGPQQAYQAYQVALAAWQARVEELQGSPTIPDSRLGLEARLTGIAQLPDRVKVKRAEREVIAREIYKILVAQRTDREQLFAPLQKTIEDHPLIRDEYDLQFKANLQTFGSLVSEPLFGIVKQNVGALRGEDESNQAVQERLSLRDMNAEEDAIVFANSLHDLLHEAARMVKPQANDLASILRKERTADEAYNLIYGFEYLNPHYTLSFQQTPIEQLSPGQRGALLLIFYLLVDKGRNPIILDQPEENLDNETVVNLLVPVLAHAKESRQILMVTHNPNLAVVCDAEQIIMCRLDRKEGAKISYETGSIESPRLNANVVTVLEGTKRAFDNRGGKYH